MFHIVQPYANGPRRFEHGAVVSSHRTADDAFDQLDRLTSILATHGLSGVASAITVVTDDRSPVTARDHTTEATPIVEASLRGSNASETNREAWQTSTAIPSIDGWDFVEPSPAESVAFVRQRDGRLEVWRLNADGASRMLALEDDLQQLRLAVATTPPVSLPDPPECRPAPLHVATTRTTARSFLSDYHVRIRWPRNVSRQAERRA